MTYQKAMKGDLYECAWRLAKSPVDDWPREMIGELSHVRKLLGRGPLPFSCITTKAQAAILLAMEHRKVIRIIPGNPTVAELRGSWGGE